MAAILVSPQGTAQVYSTPATGLIVRLPGWLYPVVVDTHSGEVQYDNYGGSWGAQPELDKLLEAYAIEKARIEARRAGHSITEQLLEDGAIKLQIHVGAGIGGAA